MAELFVEKLGKEIAEKALDEYKYKGNTIREWADLLINGDVVEVVRCKDCKYWNNGDCYRLELSRPDDFCSYGERKEEWKSTHRKNLTR